MKIWLCNNIQIVELVNPLRRPKDMVILKFLGPIQPLNIWVYNSRNMYEYFVECLKVETKPSTYKTSPSDCLF